jgi:hypothetical protein
MSVEFPTAELRPQPWGRSVFLLCVLLAIVFCVLLLWLRGERGLIVMVAARDAHGLEVHDPVRFRGLDIGSVRALRLSPARDHVEVELALDPAYADLARSGTRFWIAHPRLDWERISGLDTVVGTRYVGCLPGEGEPARRFVGLEDEPLPQPPGALALRFHAVDRDGLHRAAPLCYRGLVIGRLTAVGLSSDARWVEAEGYVEAGYRHLVFADSRFCPNGGLRVDAGLTGMSVEVPPLAQLGTGGLALVNRPQPGEPAVVGQRFRVADRSVLAEAGEQGAVVIGRPHEALPAVVGISLNWRVPRRLWWDGSGRREGLALPFRSGLLVPAALLAAPSGAEEQHLLVGGKEVALPALGDTALQVLDGLEGLPAPVHSWRSPVGPEDLLVRLDAHRALPVAAESLLAGDDGWHLGDEFPGHLVLPGTPVLAATDEALIGLLVDQPWRVLPLPADF